MFGQYEALSSCCRTFAAESRLLSILQIWELGTGCNGYYFVSQAIAALILCLVGETAMHFKSLEGPILSLVLCIGNEACSSVFWHHYHFGLSIMQQA